MKESKFLQSNKTSSALLPSILYFMGIPLLYSSTPFNLQPCQSKTEITVIAISNGPNGTLLTFSSIPNPLSLVPVAILTGLKLASISTSRSGCSALLQCIVHASNTSMILEDLKKQCVTTFRKKLGYSAVLCHVFLIHAPYVE
jgi:hypothetical protein